MPKLVAIASATDQLDPFSRGLTLLSTHRSAAVTTLGQEWKSMPLDTVVQELVEKLEPAHQGNYYYI